MNAFELHFFFGGRTVVPFFLKPFVQTKIKSKMTLNISAGEQLLADLSSWPTLKSESSEFIEEMTEYQREQFDGWSRDNLQDIESKNLSLQTSSQVVYFEAGKDMKVRRFACASIESTYKIYTYCYFRLATILDLLVLVVR